MVRLLTDGMELRLTRDDLMELLEVGLKEKVLGYDLKGTAKVTDLSLRPKSKYVVTVTITDVGPSDG